MPVNETLVATSKISLMFFIFWETVERARCDMHAIVTWDAMNDTGTGVATRTLRDGHSGRQVSVHEHLDGRLVVLGTFRRDAFGSKDHVDD